MKSRKMKARFRKVSVKPGHEKFPWPGLNAKDHLSRVVTREVKNAKQVKGNEEWAKEQIARVLDYVAPQTAIEFVFREVTRRGLPLPRFEASLSRSSHPSSGPRN